MVYRLSILVLFFALHSNAQDISLVAPAKLEQENKNNQQQKIYLHTDKSFYMAGDIIWFKVYNTEGRANKPIALDGLVYAELLDINNKAILQGKISLKGKTGNGSFQLPLSVPSGNYVLRSYTAGMKDLPVSQYFQKKITVINALKSPEPDSTKITPDVYVSYFPEGGNLVQGLPSIVGVKLFNELGRGVDASGYLLDENNDTLQKINTLVFGLGSFVYTPVAGKEYRINFILPDGSSTTSSLPVAEAKGYVMQVEEQSATELKVSVRSNIAADGSQIFLFGHTRQVQKLAQITNMAGGQAVFVFNKNIFDKGISALTVFAEGKPVCERLIFQKPAVSPVKLVADHDEYFSRRKVVLNLDKESQGITDSSLLSFSVYKVDTLQSRDEMDLLNYIWLTSDLTGNVEHPAFYFSGHSLAEKAADNLMLTHGWRRFSWKEILSGSNEKTIESPVELNHQVISARVFDPAKQKPVKDVSVYLSVPVTHHKLFVSKTDDQGIARFQVKDFYGNGDVVLQLQPLDSMYKLEILSPFSDKPSTLSLNRINTSGLDLSLVEKYSIAMQASNIYHGEKLSSFHQPVITDSFPFYGKPGISYNLDDYKRFTTFEEVFREYVREINVGIRGSGLTLKVFNENTREMREGNNLVTIDGVPMFRTSKFFGYDPLKFKKIDIITTDYVLGRDKFNSVAAFYTYDQNFQGMEAEQGALVVNYEGLQKQREFYAPQYQNEQQVLSRIPDMRTTLNWQTSVQSKSIEFYTSDTKGKYLVTLQGFDVNGLPVSWSRFIDVK